MTNRPSLPNDCLFTNTVYSLVFPETERLVRQVLTKETEILLGRHQDAFLKTQDGMHEPFMDAWIRFTRNALNWNPNDYPEHYPCNGSSEAIFHLLSQSVAKQESIVVFDGDYEGYEMLSRSVGNTDVRFVQREHWREYMEAWAKGTPGYPKKAQFWFSHPSAIDGNVWADYPEFLDAALPLVESGVLRLFVDLTYVGRADLKTPITLNHPSIAAIVFSLSKVMGAYYRRIGGCMSREPIPSLWGNRWFKNLDSLYIGQRWLEEGQRDALEEGRKYKPFQQYALDLALDSVGGAKHWQESGLVWATSDVNLLTYALCPSEVAAPPFQSVWDSAARGRDRTVSRRLCLTPALTRLLNFHNS